MLPLFKTPPPTAHLHRRLCQLGQEASSNDHHGQVGVRDGDSLAQHLQHGRKQSSMGSAQQHMIDYLHS